MFKYSQCSMRQKYTDEPTFLKKKHYGYFAKQLENLSLKYFTTAFRSGYKFYSALLSVITSDSIQPRCQWIPCQRAILDQMIFSFIKQGSLGRGTHHHTLASLTSSHELRRGLSMVSQLQFFGQQLLTLIEYRALQAAHDQKSMLN